MCIRDRFLENYDLCDQFEVNGLQLWGIRYKGKELIIYVPESLRTEMVQ